MTITIKLITRGLLALLLLCAALSTSAAPSSLQVIPLKHRSAAELIPILRPFLSAEGTLAGTGYQLIVRTTPENLDQLREILQRFDTAPRRLMITVMQSADGGVSRRDVQISGQTQIGSSARNTELHARVLNTASRRADADTQQIQVLEGHEALIQIGQSVPTLERSINTSSGNTAVQDQIAYKDVMRGFYVLPRINGDQVTLDVSPRRDTLSETQGGAIDVQRMHTTVSGRLGEWLEIGGSVQEDNRQEHAYTQSAHTGSRDQARVLLKVEELQN